MGSGELSQNFSLNLTLKSVHLARLTISPVVYCSITVLCARKSAAMLGIIPSVLNWSCSCYFLFPRRGAIKIRPNLADYGNLFCNF